MPASRHSTIKYKAGWQVFLLVLLAAYLPAGRAQADCTGLGCSCSITADPLDFGNYNPLSGSTVDATGNVTVECGALVLGAFFSYEITLGPGASGNAAGRTMSNGSGTMSYNLYTDSSRSIVWGDGSGGTGTVTNSYTLSILFPRSDDFPVYGRLPSGQNAEVGSYSDTIVATVIF